jgi:tetratricopeptide (TPR) repeat protein
MSHYYLIPTLFGVGATIALIQPAAMAKSATEVGEIAKAITVHLSSDLGENGSGIILQRQGDIYTVLTAAHVVRRTDAEYTIATSDDRRHQIIPDSIRKVPGDVDLAVVKFRSSTNYATAKLGNSNLLKSGMDIYVSGFPAPTAVITQSIFVFRSGQVSANSSRDFAKGYSLLYSNDTLPGMSGGSILNTDGEVVGVHGRGDRETSTGIKTGFNAGITIAKFAELAQTVGVTLDTQVAIVQQSNTPSADDFFASGFQKSEAGDFRGALEDYDRAISLNPSFAVAYTSRGLLKHEKLNDVSGALADYDRAISLNPNSALTYYNRGVLKAKLNDVSGALSDYDRAISLNPNSAIAYNNRGLLKDEKLNDLPGALADYDRAISLNPNSAIAYNNRGNLKTKLNDLPGALLDYDRAISLNPNSANAYYNRGTLKHGKLNDLPGALADYNRAISLNPNFALAYYNRGLLKHEKLNDLPGALADYDRAISLNPNSANAYKNRGNLKATLNDLPGALADYDRAISLNPNYADAYYNRGLLKKNRMNDRPGAIADFRTAATLDRQQGNHEWYRQSIDRLRELGVDP